MKVAELWIEAAEMAEMWAAVTRSTGARLQDREKANLHAQVADQVDALARAYRQKASEDHREIDFDDRATPVVRDIPSSELLDDEDTDPDAAT